jgi:cation transport protein ChaC
VNPELSEEAHPELEPAPPADAALGRLLRREDFTAERARRIAEQVLQRGATPLMSEEARKASLSSVRATVPAGSDVWVFGYGSLMWNPAINVKLSKPAHVRGYHRTFCLKLTAGRGTVEAPGLMLGIDRGGSCAGMAHCIAAEGVESELTILWYREMLSGAYEPRWINAEIEGVGKSRVLAFAINRSHPRYEGALDEDVMAARIAAAKGFLGTNRDYLFRTIAHLNEHGLADAPLQRLAERVRALSETDTTGATS